MDSDPALNSILTVALVVAAYAGSVHPLTSHLMTRRFIPWALGHRDTRALSRLQLFLYVHCDVDGSNTSLVPARGHPDLPQKDHYSGVAWRPAPCAAHPQTTAAMQECGRRRWLKCSLEFLPNIGREAHLYLRHIVNVHGRADLADLTIFIQEGEPIGLERVWSCLGGLHAQGVEAPRLKSWSRLESLVTTKEDQDEELDRLWRSYTLRGGGCMQAGLGPLPPEDLYFASPEHKTGHGEGLLQPELKRPKSSLESALGFLNLACGLPTATVPDEAIEGCAGFGRQPRMQTQLGALLVRRLDGLCPLVASLQKAPEWLRPSRGTFIAHRSALRARPAALWEELLALSTSQVQILTPNLSLTLTPTRTRTRTLTLNPALWRELLALSTSQETELEAFFTRPPCSVSCGHHIPGRGTSKYECAQQMLAGDRYKYGYRS